MSRLADRIRAASRVESGHLGFGIAADRRPTPTMLCLLRLDKGQMKGAGAAASADAVIITGLEPDRLQEPAQKLGDVPLGLRLEEGQRAAVAAARDAGADFVLLAEGSSAEALLEEKVGLVLRLDGDESDAELRALAGLPLDALEAPPIGDPFTVRRLAALRRIALLGQTPLLVEVTAGIAASRLQAMRDAGVVGVILEGRSADKLAALRETVLALPARGRRREERAEAILPALAGVPDADDEEPDIE